MCQCSGDLTRHSQTTLKISSLLAIEAKGSQQLSSPRNRGPGAESRLFYLGLFFTGQKHILWSHHSGQFKMALRWAPGFICRGDKVLSIPHCSQLKMDSCSPNACLLTSYAGCCGRYLAKLSSVGSISEEETCEKLKGLIQRQVQMCKRNLEVMDSVRRGAQLAIEECQYQFRNRRWNCSTLDTLPVFGKVVTQGEPRERAPGELLHGAMATTAARGLQEALACLLALSQWLGTGGNGTVMDHGAGRSFLSISAGRFWLDWGSYIQSPAVPQLLGTSSLNSFHTHQVPIA